MTTFPALTLSDACALASIIRAAQENQPVARLIDDNVFSGTARSVGTDSGVNAGPIDVRDQFLRVTLTGGTDVFWPMSDLVAEHKAHTFVLDYRA